MSAILRGEFDLILEKTAEIPGRREMCLFKNGTAEIRMPTFFDDITKKRYATKGTLSTLRGFFYNTEEVSEFSPSDYAASSKYVIPTDANFTYLAPSVLRADKVELVSGSSLNIAHLFAIISHFPGLRGVYADYLADMDTGVKVHEKNIDPGYHPQVVPYSKEIVALPPKKTQAFMQIASTCAIFLLTKTLDSQVSNHLSLFLERRISSMSFIVGINAVGIEASHIINYLGGNLEKVSDLMAHFPKIKQAIFPSLVNFDSPLGTHVKEILRGTQLTLFTMVLEFLRTPEPTMLHIYPPIVSEILQFVQVWQSIYTKYGDSWEFFKLTDPMGLGTSAKKLERLGSAAYTWSTVTTGQHSLMNLKTVRLNKAYEGLAKRPLANALLTSEQKDLSQQLALIRVSGFLSNINPAIRVDHDGNPFIPASAPRVE
ncbi:putative nucleoprotein [Anopheles darlingi virus]|uniref:Nucleoprotein n=1 Tax=Anopheles darlingi virus TaxID=2546224 RepID=A0AAE6CYM5_9MONO|nr:putative nucleoprotein [Anopheles darlingi virus]QBK47205.1 putative nucleoprotein [Anopheles darlingi virus]